MSRWKTLTTSWWTKNLFEIACATVVVALLVGGIAVAIVQTPTVQLVESESFKASEDRSTPVPLSPSDPHSPEPAAPAEDRFEIVCLPDDALTAQTAGQLGCELVSQSDSSLPVALEALPDAQPAPAVHTGDPL
jgi:hypothetical protein